jgi:hypothetical protein
MQERGSRALEPCDHQRALEWLLLDLRVFIEQRFDSQPVLEHAADARTHDRAPEGMESGLALDRIQQHFERRSEIRIAEVALAGAPHGRVEQRLELEGLRTGARDAIVQAHQRGPARAGVVARGRTAQRFHRASSARRACLTTRVCGTGCESARTQRKHIVPDECPTVSIQFGTPGSRCATTILTEPSGRLTAVC